MRSHLNLEQETFLGGKLPSCASTRSAVQGILSDCCQYCHYNTDSNNDNSTELSLGLTSVTLSLLNLSTLSSTFFTGLYRDYVFKCICSSGVMDYLLFVHQSSEGCFQLHTGSTLACMEDAYLFISTSLLLPTLSFFPWEAGWAKERWACEEHWGFSEPTLQFWCNLGNLSVCMTASNGNIA